MSTPPLAPARADVRTRIAGLWIAVLFVFVYVDLFSLYRPDVRGELETGTIAGFTVDQAFLLATTAYVAIPSLAVAATLVLPPAVARTGNIVLAVLYALTVIAASYGEWWYYLLGSAVEVALLAGVVVTAARWPRSATAADAPRLSRA